MYSVLDFGKMAVDGVRVDAYAKALAKVVKPGSVVVDLGAGTGIFSLLAARAGAARVHAIDPNPAIWLLPEIAAENGLSDRITIHPTSSFDVDLPEKADVVVGDLRGMLPFFEPNIRAMRDAHDRFLKSDGTLVPTRDKLFVAAVETPALWSTVQRARQSFEQFGWNGNAAMRSVLNTPNSDRSAPLQQSDVLTTAASWATIEYATCDVHTFESTVELTCTRRGIAHGLCIWFEATLLDDIRYTTAPGWSLAYGRCYLPLLEPVQLEPEDRIRVTLRAEEMGDRWAWDTEFLDKTGHCKTQYRQSSFFGIPTSPEALMRSSSKFCPTVSEEGKLVALALEAMDGTRTIKEIAEDLRGSKSEVQHRMFFEQVRSLAERYSR